MRGICVDCGVGTCVNIESMGFTNKLEFLPLSSSVWK